MARWDDIWFWVTRHGRTEANDEGIYRSWSNYWKAQLSDEGRQDAKEAAIYLAAIKAPIEIIIADSLDRTIETAEIIGSHLGVQTFEFLRGLHPLNMGDLTLKSKSENPVEPYMKDPDKRIPGGEKRKEFDARMKETYDAIMQVVSVVPGGNILIVGHGSTVAYFHNQVFNKGEENISYEGLVDPGGVLQVTQEGIKPLTKIRSKNKSEKKEKIDVRVEKLTDSIDSEKLDKAVVLYMDAEAIAKPKGAHCDDCRMFIGDGDTTGRCGAVSGKIEPLGVCGLYVFGEPNNFTKSGILSKKTAGYIDDGPTHCGSCKYFDGSSQCEKVNGEVEFGGCCNYWTPK